MTGTHLAQTIRRAASALLFAALAALSVLSGATPALCAELSVAGLEQLLAVPQIQSQLLSHLEEELATQERTLGQDHPEVADTLVGLANLRGLLSQYDKAEPLHKRALEIREKALGPEHPSVAQSLNNLAGLYDSQAQYEKAEPLHKRALAIWEKALGPEHPSVAASLNNLAELYRNQAQYDKAEPLYQRALAIWEKALGPEHPNVAASLNNLAILYYSQAQYDKAEPLYKRALAIKEKVYGPDHSDTALSLNNLAELYRSQAQYDKAETLYKRALEIVEKRLGPEHPSVALSLSSLAALYDSQAQYGKAEPLYKRALEIREKALGPEHPDVATSLNNLAALYYSQAQYDKAEPLHKRALEIREKALGPDHPDVAISLNNLAVLYNSQAQYDKAEPLYKRALEIREKVYGPDHPDTASSLNNLATLYERQAQYEKAEPLLQRALAIREKQLGPEHPDTAQSLNNLATLYERQAQYEKAEPLYRRALPIAEGSGEPELLWNVQGALGNLYEQSSPDLAIFYNKRAVNTLQGVRAGNTQMDMTAQRSFLKRKGGYYTALADRLFAQNRLAEGQQVLDMLKEAEYHEFNGQGDEDDPRRSRVAYSPREAKWDTRFRELSEKLQAADAGSPEYAAAQKDFDAFFEEVKAAFAPDAPGEPNRLDNASPLQKPLAELGEGVVLVQYLMPQERLWLLLTTKGGMKAVEVSVGAAELNRKIAAFREAVVTRNPEANTLGRDLFDLLIAPAKDDLQQARTLMLAPDGALRYLPFAALHDGEKYLVERFTIANFTDMTKDRITDRPVADWNFAGFGVSRAVGGHSPLPAVPEELRGIHDNAIPGEIRLDEEFTGATFKAGLAQSPPVVHVATHFVFEKGNEQASYLQLGDGGRLTLRDLRGGYRFEGVDLVALSACDTAVGGGEEKDGREVEGLGVLVQRQGAKGVLASLWPVNDASTGRFMRLFYGYRQQRDMNKAEALRKAQLAFIEGRVDAELVNVDRNRGRVPAGQEVGAPVTARPTADIAHPYFWAPFILMGNWL